MACRDPIEASLSVLSADVLGSCQVFARSSLDVGISVSSLAARSQDLSIKLHEQLVREMK